MKSITVLYVSLVAFVFGLMALPLPASAHHCTVKQGDSMWEIAERYNVLFKKVLELNKHHADPNLIHPDDKVHLPDGSEGQTTSDHSKTDDIQTGTDVATENSESTQATEILRLVNQERSKQGLHALSLSKDLTSIANVKAKDMMSSHYFSHNSPTYGSPFEMLQRFGVHYSSAGENIASGQRSAEQVMQDWMNSSGHRANILNKDYTLLGVGFAEGGSGGTYWVQLFTKP